MILKFYNIEKNSFYQMHKFWMQFDVFINILRTEVSFITSIKSIKI